MHGGEHDYNCPFNLTLKSGLIMYCAVHISMSLLIPVEIYLLALRQVTEAEKCEK